MTDSRTQADTRFKTLCSVLGAAATLPALGMICMLFYKSLPVMQKTSVYSLLTESAWLPSRETFGFAPFIFATFAATATAIVISAPLCILTALYLSEYAPRSIRRYGCAAVDLLAGIPSVIYGTFGIMAVVPAVRTIADILNIPSTGYCLLSGSILLSVMTFPMITSISYEVIREVPEGLKDASLSLGATKWETVKKVILRKSFPGICAAIIIGTSRALGETMAVLMVAGNVVKIPVSVFEPVYPLAALLANTYGEMLSVPLYDSALMFSSLILFIIVALFAILGRIMLKLSVRKCI